MRRKGGSAHFSGQEEGDTESNLHATKAGGAGKGATGLGGRLAEKPHTVLGRLRTIPWHHDHRIAGLLELRIVLICTSLGFSFT